jgi:transcriptional regulator with XRE-family HTH domain
MTSTEHTKNETKRSVYDTCDPQYLRELREAAGIDLAVLARSACLSVAQVRQLETDDSDGLFYSDAIKRQAYKRLLMILGAEPPTVEVPEDLRDANKVADAHLNTLDQIVAMSHQPVMNRTTADVLGVMADKVKEHKQATAALLLLAMAIVLFVLHGPLRPTETAAVMSAAAAPEPAAVASVPPVVVEPPAVVASAASMPAVPALPASVPVPVASAGAVSTSAVVVASAAAINKTLSCAYSTETMPQLTPFVAHKEGRYVYLVSTSNVDVCVVDGNKQATTLQLKAGENRSVYGVAPWQVSSPQLQKIQIYFQGGRVTLPDAANHVKLIEVPVSR